VIKSYSIYQFMDGNFIFSATLGPRSKSATYFLSCLLPPWIAYLLKLPDDVGYRECKRKGVDRVRFEQLSYLSPTANLHRE
jgi:hypothetical protein